VQQPWKAVSKYFGRTRRAWRKCSGYRMPLQKGESVLSDSQVEFIKHHTAILGEDGEAAMREIQRKATESVCLPAEIARVLDSYYKDLSWKVGLRELSNDLEKDKERERLVQLEAMEAEVSKFKIARAQGNMANLMRVKGALSAQLKKYLEDIEADEEDGVSSYVTGKWKKTALDLTKDAMGYLNGIGRVVGTKSEDALGPLRRALGKVASLGEDVSSGVLEPEEGGLRDLAKRLEAVKKELMVLGRGLMVSQPPASATEVHELISKAEEAIRSSQRTIKAAFRGLGVASDISKAGSLDVAPPPRSPIMGSLTARLPPARAEPPKATSYGMEGEVANLMGGWWGPRPTTVDGPHSAASMWSTPASERSGGPTGRHTTGMSGRAGVSQPQGKKPS
jgi:hypothetical protein